MSSLILDRMTYDEARTVGREVALSLKASGKIWYTPPLKNGNPNPPPIKLSGFLKRSKPLLDAMMQAGKGANVWIARGRTRSNTAYSAAVRYCDRNGCRVSGRNQPHGGKPGLLVTVLDVKKEENKQ